MTTEVSMGSKSMPDWAVPYTVTSRVSAKSARGRMTVKPASLHPSTTTESPRKTGAPPMLADASMLALLEEKLPPSRNTALSKAVSPASAMAILMW